LWKRELETVQDRALWVLQVADEHDLKFGKALGRCLLGAANKGIGRPEDGLAEVRDGLDLYHSLKTPPVFSPLLLNVQASRKALRQLIFWKPATFWKAADRRLRHGRRVDPNSGEHDRVAAADGRSVPAEQTYERG